MDLSYITSFDDNLKQLSMNSRFEASTFETGPTFEKTINEIKDNRLKSITSAVMNISDITSFDSNCDQLSMSNRIEVSKFEPGTTF